MFFSFSCIISASSFLAVSSSDTISSFSLLSLFSGNAIDRSSSNFLISSSSSIFVFFNNDTRFSRKRNLDSAAYRRTYISSSASIAFFRASFEFPYPLFGLPLAFSNESTSFTTPLSSVFFRRVDSLSVSLKIAVCSSLESGFFTSLFMFSIESNLYFSSASDRFLSALTMNWSYASNPSPILTGTISLTIVNNTSCASFIVDIFLVSLMLGLGLISK